MDATKQHGGIASYLTTEVADTAIILGLVIAAWMLYSITSVQSLTWIFAGGDSGDWLTAAMYWHIPHPMGSPVYVLWSKGLWWLWNALPWGQTSFPNFLAVFGSGLPAAATVGLVYVNVQHLAKDRVAAILAALVLLGVGAVWSQSVIVEEYALAMFLTTLGLTLWIQKRLNAAWLVFGFGMGVHALVLAPAITCLYLSRVWREDRVRWRSLLWFLPGLATYTYILALMAIPSVPKLLAGPLSVRNLHSYWFDLSGYVGGISPLEIPKRLWNDGGVILGGLGMAVVPLVWGGKRWEGCRERVALVSIVAVITAFVLFELDPATYTYLTQAAPAAAILVGLGLARMTHPIHRPIVLASALVLTLGSLVYLNPRTLWQSGDGAEYMRELAEVPPGSIVTVNAGHASLALFLYAREHPERRLVPFIVPFYERYEWYRDELRRQNPWLCTPPEAITFIRCNADRPLVLAGNMTPVDHLNVGNLSRYSDWYYLRWLTDNPPWGKAVLP